MDQNGYVEAEGSGLDTLARDAQLLQALISSLDPNRRDQERTLHKLNQLESKLLDLEEQLADARQRA